MTAELIWRNVAAYCMQVGLVIGMAAILPSLLQLRMPRVRLAYWHILLAVCLALPLLQSWQPDGAAGKVDVSTVITGTRGASSSVPWNFPSARVVLWILAAGALTRLILLVIGCARLWLYRRRSDAFRIALPLNTKAELRLSNRVTSPVTFGFFRPVVLVPPQFPELEPRAQAAILLHELLHVERRDWLYTLAEEIVRALLWFHPPIWWLLGEIQLTREQAVDRAVIDRTGARDEYLDALLSVAGAQVKPDLAPAPLFLRRRHLKQRVLAILKEARMSRRRVISSLAVSLGTLLMVCWAVTLVFPLIAAGPGQAPARIKVGGNLQSANLIHQERPIYPAEAKRQRVSGPVHLQAIIGKGGAVQELQVVSGHPLLVPAAVDAVRHWVYRPTLLNGNAVEVSTRIDVNFTLSK